MLEHFGGAGALQPEVLRKGEHADRVLMYRPRDIVCLVYVDRAERVQDYTCFSN
jgi:hypothetical protein